MFLNGRLPLKMITQVSLNKIFLWAQMKKDKFILKACSLREKTVSSLCFQISNGQNDSKSYKAKITKIKMSGRAKSTVAYLMDLFLRFPSRISTQEPAFFYYKLWLWKPFPSPSLFSDFEKIYWIGCLFIQQCHQICFRVYHSGACQWFHV